MSVEEIEERLAFLAETVATASSQRDELIRELRGLRSSRQVAAICGRSHAYVCRVWRETNA